MIFKRFKKKFEVILFKSHKDKSFYDSPEPSCLRNCPVLWDWVHGLWNKLSRFRVLITWALERHYSLPPPPGAPTMFVKKLSPHPWILRCFSCVTGNLQACVVAANIGCQLSCVCVVICECVCVFLGPACGHTGPATTCDFCCCSVKGWPWD